MQGRSGLVGLGAALVVAGLGLWLVGDFSLPARRPPTRIHFDGLARALAGLSPMGVGFGLIVLARRGDGRAPQWLIGAGLLAALTAFLLAPRI